MDQIHLSPLVDQIQLALGHITNTRVPRVGCHPPPQRVYMEAPKRLNNPYLITRDTSPSRSNFEVFRFSSSDGCPTTATCLASTQALRSRRVSSALKHLGACDHGGQTAPPRRLDRPGWTHLLVESSASVFVAQPSDPVVFW
jgi:hypothetical protein